MKAFSNLFLSALLLGAVAFAQTSPATPGAQQPPASQPQPQSPSTQAPQSRSSATAQNPGQENAPKRIAPGSVIPVQLTKTVDAKKAKQGDEVVAKVPEDLKSNSGQVIIPKDTRVIGHITEAQPRSKQEKESQVGIAFDRAVMKDGTEVQMPMSIQAIIGQQNNANDQGGGGTAPSASTAGPGNAGAQGRGGMNGAAAPPQNEAPGGTAEAPNGGSQRPQITSETQGVVGISNLKLESPGQSTPQGSVVTSEKNNVKLESGTMMLLKVNQ